MCFVVSEVAPRGVFAASFLPRFFATSFFTLVFIFSRPCFSRSWSLRVPLRRRDGQDSGFGLMFPDLRLVITATILTFLLAVCAGLFVSVRVFHTPPTMRHDMASLDESPISRISLAWPMPGLDRSLALRELTTILKSPPDVTTSSCANCVAPTEMRPAESPTRPESPPVADVTTTASDEKEIVGHSEAERFDATGSIVEKLHPDAGDKNQKLLANRPEEPQADIEAAAPDAGAPVDAGKRHEPAVAQKNARKRRSSPRNNASRFDRLDQGFPSAKSARRTAEPSEFMFFKFPSHVN